MTTRRQWLAAAGTAAVASMLPRGPQGAQLDIKTSSQSLFRVRTITAGVTLGSLDDLSPIHGALTTLQQARTKFEQAGYEVQTLRIATNPVLASADAAARLRALPALETLDKAVSARGVIVSVGPLLTEDRDDADLPSWCAELVQRTRSISFSVSVASGERGMHRQSCATAAGVILALSKALAGGVANFRFAAAANVPAGTPFFPVGYHDGDHSLAVGLESARVVQAAFTGAAGANDAEQRLRSTLNKHLSGVETLARRVASDANLRYLGIDSSPAPGLDSSIGGAIETLTQVPFGSASTLAACATITSALKSLDVRTCGYSGLMLPVLEDPVLAQRATEGRYGIEELLLYSSVCGTGLDVVPIPGDAAAPAVARLIGDVAALSAKLSKPLSARLFPAPGKKAGDLVAFDDPHLTATSVFPLDADK
jgi:uncharacterized protein (UPF0210 family)